ncbi:MAG: hypothetical protein EA350_10810 [Gemmatimonadales bacterium]|nr:MAG: hypothetical protein EA350_10810 [Gemmatimonadales bacterium]
MIPSPWSRKVAWVIDPGGSGGCAATPVAPDLVPLLAFPRSGAFYFVLAWPTGEAPRSLRGADRPRSSRNVERWNRC